MNSRKAGRPIGGVDPLDHLLVALLPEHMQRPGWVLLQGLPDRIDGKDVAARGAQINDLAQQRLAGLARVGDPLYLVDAGRAVEAVVFSPTTEGAILDFML